MRSRRRALKTDAHAPNAITSDQDAGLGSGQPWPVAGRRKSQECKRNAATERTIERFEVEHSQRAISR
jgi:hypothetical protein